MLNSTFRLLGSYYPWSLSKEEIYLKKKKKNTRIGDISLWKKNIEK